MSVRAVYEEELKKRGFQSDPAQLRAIEALERCAQEWSAFKAKRSIDVPFYYLRNQNESKSSISEAGLPNP